MESYGIDYSVLKHKRDRLEILVWNRKKGEKYDMREVKNQRNYKKSFHFQSQD